MVKENPANGGLDVKAITVALDALLCLLPDDPEPAVVKLSNRKRKELRGLVGEFQERLRRFHLALDPIRHPDKDALDPSDPQGVGELIAKTLLLQPLTSMSDLQGSRFYGSGAYAIYYRGSFDAYGPVSGTDTPLYVGKVDPKTPGAATVEEQGMKLCVRLVNDHARSIRSAENLDLDDFDCRYLVVKSAWQNTAETYLIDQLNPIWNSDVGICYGIGKHGDSPSTRANTRSPWDTLHPGRSWAWTEGNTPNPLSPEEIKAQIAQHYRDNPPMQLVNT